LATLAGIPSAFVGLEATACDSPLIPGPSSLIRGFLIIEPHIDNVERAVYCNTMTTRRLILACVTVLVLQLQSAEAVRFDFEDGMQGWLQLEGWLGNPRKPTSKVDGNARTPEVGQFLIATHAGRGGILESPVFTVEGSEATFLLGGAGKPSAYVSLHTEDGKEVRRADVPMSAAPDISQAYKLKHQKWDVSALKGRNVFLRICAEPFGYAIVKRVHSHVHESIVVFDNFSVEG